ncbi:MAG: copper transporter [Actinomycetota bacterium]
MISFRYHLVTIVAVFLALGIGVLAGTTVLDQGLVNRLERQTAELTTDLNDLRQIVREQDATLATMEEFSQQVFERLAPGVLVNAEAVVLTHDLVETAAVGRAQAALEGADAQVQAVFTLQSKMALPDEGARTELAEALGAPEQTDPQALQRLALERIAGRLAQGPGQRAVNRTQEDVLTRLLSAGFLTVEGPGGDRTLAGVGGEPLTLTVVVGGGRPEAGAASELLVPLVEDLRAEGFQTAAAEPLLSEAPFVADVREVAGDEPPIVTVDDVDIAMGQLALVLGLQRLLLGEGGNYGVEPGAIPIPPLQPDVP